MTDLEALPSMPGTEQGYTLKGDPNVFMEFSMEAEDHLSIIETLVLSATDDFRSLNLDAISRGIHSIKGASSYFGLREVSETSHLTELALNQLREGKRRFDQNFINLVMEYAALQKELLSAARSAMKADRLLSHTESAAEFAKRIQSK